MGNNGATFHFIMTKSDGGIIVSLAENAMMPPWLESCRPLPGLKHHGHLISLATEWVPSL